MYNTDNELFNCITIKVETEIRTDDYNKKENRINNGYTYIVKEEEAANAMIFIEKLFNQCGLPCARVYPIKFDCVPKDYIWTEQKIIDQVVRIAGKLGTIPQVSLSRSAK